MLLSGCGDRIFSPDFFELTPGSDQCKRALTGITQIGNSEQRRDPGEQARIIAKCLPRGGAGDEQNQPTDDDEEGL